VCKHFKPAQSSLRKLTEFSRERSILNITLHDKTKYIVISLVCLFFLPWCKNAKFTMIEAYPKLLLRILQIVCLHWFVVLEGVTRSKLKSQTTGPEFSMWIFLKCSPWLWKTWTVLPEHTSRQVVRVDYGLLKLIRDIKHSRLRRRERRLAKNEFIFYVRIS